MPDYQSMPREDYIENNMRFYRLYCEARMERPFSEADEEYVRGFLGEVWDGTTQESDFVVPSN